MRILSRNDICARIHRRTAKSITQSNGRKKRRFMTPPHPHHQHSLCHPALRRSTPPTTEPVSSIRCQTNGFAMLHQYAVLESGPQGIRGHCMTFVMRYLLMNRVEREANNDLKSSLLGSDSPSGLYNSVKPPEWYTITTPLSLWRPPLSDILCCFGVMFTLKGSELNSAKRFPSQQKAESIK